MSGFVRFSWPIRSGWLSDVFSGIVLNFSRPYRPGDWISIDGGTDGRVIDMNWRATHVLTGKSDLAIVPNSTIAKAKIVNTSSPSGIHGMSVTIQLDPKTPPSTGAEILRHAIQNTINGAFVTLRSARREMSRQDERRGMRLRAPPAPA